MKKLSIICAFALVFALMAGPAFAVSICKDYLEDGNAGGPAGLKTFDDEISIDYLDTVSMDIWINDIPTPPGSLITAGFWVTYDPTAVTIGNVQVYDGVNGPAGPWDPTMTGIVPDPGGPGTYLATMGNLATVLPDAGGDIIMGKIDITCIKPGDTTLTFMTVPGFDTVVGDSIVLDPDITPNVVTIHQVITPCTCTIDPAAGTTIINENGGTKQYTVTEHGTCLNPPSFMWDDGGCTQGSIDAAGLFTANDPITAAEICTITAVDVANTDEGGAPVMCTSDVDIRVPAKCQLKIYRGGVCHEAAPIDDPAYNRPGRRGLAMTCCEEETFCICTDCPDYDIVWTAEVVEGDTSITLQITLNPDGTMTFKAPCPCPSELTVVKITATDTVNTLTDEVYITIGRVRVGLGKTNAHPDSQTADIPLTLYNPDNYVRAIQVDVGSCDMAACAAYTLKANCEATDDDYFCAWDEDTQTCSAVDNMVCTECIVDEDRAPEFICSANEQADGTCRVTLFTTEPDDLIQRGSGAVALIKYDILGELTSKDCICLWPYNVKVADQFNEALCGCPKPGEICFYVCGDIYPQDCYYCKSCGDGIVDLFDILEEIDIILGLQTATLCQQLHGDVPLGMPPYCGNPAGVNPPNCETDGVIDIFDALVIIDKALSKMNCCDYCMYGIIY